MRSYLGSLISAAVLAATSLPTHALAETQPLSLADALRIARTSGNDYLPELEAVMQEEFTQFFEEPLPKPSELQQDGVVEYKFRYLGMIQTRGEKFYLFARLDPYEQAELRKKSEAKPQTPANAATPPTAGADTAVRPRRASAP